MTKHETRKDDLNPIQYMVFMITIGCIMLIVKMVDIINYIREIKR